MENINPHNVRIPKDNVLIKLKPVHEYVEFQSGGKLLIDYTYNPSQHQCVVGEIVKTPEKFTEPNLFTKRDGIEWLPALDVVAGDKVIVDYFKVLQNFGTLAHRYIDNPTDMYIHWDGEYYVFVPYHELFCKLDPVVPLNGWVIYEAITLNNTFGEYTKTYISQNTGIVRYVGKPNVKYVDGRDDVTGLEAGDKIVFKKGMYRKLENDIHATLDKNLYLVQAKWIMGKFTS